MAGDGKPYDFLSRFFAPWVGIDEDPVTGSAQAVLGPYWAARLTDAPADMKARQCSPRGGDVTVTVDAQSSRVVLGGHATIVSQGQLLLPGSLFSRQDCN